MARVRIGGKIGDSSSFYNDSGERPVRKQLKETTIESSPPAAEGDQSAADDSSSSSSGSRGRKRSFEESRDEGRGAAVDSHDNPGHTRKRSRDCAPLESESSKMAKNMNTGASSQNLALENGWVYPDDKASDDGEPSSQDESLSNDSTSQLESNEPETAHAGKVSDHKPYAFEEFSEASLPSSPERCFSAIYPPSDYDANSDPQDSASHDSDINIKKGGAEDANARNVSQYEPYMSRESETAGTYAGCPVPTSVEGWGRFWLQEYPSFRREEANSNVQDLASHESDGNIRGEESETAGSSNVSEDVPEGCEAPSSEYRPTPVNAPQHRPWPGTYDYWKYGANPHSQDPASHDAIGRIKKEASGTTSPSIVSEYEPPDPWPAKAQTAATQDPPEVAPRTWPRLNLHTLAPGQYYNYSNYEANCDSQDVSDREPSEIANVRCAQNVSDPGPAPCAPPADVIQAFRVGLFVGYFFNNLFGATLPDPREMDALHKNLQKPAGRSSAELGKHNVVENDANTMTQDTERTTKAPTKKRSREQLDDDNRKKSDTATETAPSHVQTDTTTETAPARSATEGEPEKKRHRDNSQERKSRLDDKGFAASAFGKAAATSPFAALGASKTQKPSADSATATTTSAFSSSGLAAFAGAGKSPFSALGSSTSSVFKSSGPTSATGFGSSSTSSGFGALGSGFSGVGGGFKAAGNAGGLTSFASPDSSATFGESKPKQLGDEESEDDEDSDDEEEPDNFKEEKTDERFFEQTIETGEEGEYTALAFKAKLFNFSNKEWKERGAGTFKLNVKQDGDTHCGSRMVMRSDGSLRVILNSPLFKDMTFGDAKGNEPCTKDIHLAGLEDGRTVPLLLRTPSAEYASKLYEHIQAYLELLR